MKLPKIIFIVIAILIVGSLSGYTFISYASLSKDYDTTTQTITISKYGTKIADVQLNTPLVYNVIDRGEGIKQLVAELTLSDFSSLTKYQDVFKKMEFYNVKDNLNSISREFIYKYKEFYDVEVDDKEYVCVKKEVIENSTTYLKEFCSWEKIGTKIIEKFKWKELTDKTDLSKFARITIGIFTDVQPKDYVEWIPTLFDVKIDEWAVWTEALNTDLEAYYTFNETSGLGVWDSTTNHSNVTIANRIEDTDFSWQSGLIDNSLQIYRMQGYLDVVTNVNADSSKSWTIAGWMKSDVYGDTESQAIYGVYQDIYVIPRSYNGLCADSSIMIYNSYTTTMSCSGVVINEDGAWHHYATVWNTTGLTLYLDGNSTPILAVDGSYESDKFKLGGTSDGANHNFSIDEIGIWNRTLSTSEISDLYNGGNGITYISVFNVAPILKDITIEPSIVYPTSLLQCNVTIYDADADTLTVYMNWTNGTTHYSSHTFTGKSSLDKLNFTLAGSPQATGEVWNCSAQVWDSELLSNLNSTTRTISSGKPTVTTIGIGRTKGEVWETFYTNSTIEGWFKATDPFDDPVTIYCNWTNGTTHYSTHTKSVSIDTAYNFSLAPVGIQAKGETWNFSCEAWDGNELSEMNSTTTTILNTAPTTPTINDPVNESRQIGNSVTLNCDGSTDLDGDTIYYVFFGDATTNPPTTALQNTTGEAYDWTTTDGNTYWWFCKAQDTEDTSGATTIKQFLENNLSIAYNITISPDPAFIDSTLNGSAMVMDSEGDTLTVYMNWTNGTTHYSSCIETGVTSESMVSCELTPEIQAISETWNFTIRIWDSYELSLFNSTTITISPDPIIYTAENLTNLATLNLPVNSTWYYNVSDPNIDNCYYNTTENTTLTFLATCNETIYTQWETEGSKYIQYCVNNTGNREACNSKTIKVYHHVYTQNESKDPVGDGEQLTLGLRINMTDIDEWDQTNATLTFNSITYYNPLILTKENYTIFIKTITIPYGTGSTGGTSINWNWTYNIKNSTDLLVTQATVTNTTTVYSPDIDDCSVYTVMILNYTLLDEEDKEFNANLTNQSIEVDITLRSVYLDVEWNYSSTKITAINQSYIHICVPSSLLNNASYKLDVVTKYSCDNHVVEYNYINDYNLSTPTTQHISLYDLKTADSTSFLVKYQDENYLPVEEAVVDLWRYYVGEGIYLSVEHGQTDDNGLTRLHFVTEDVKYKAYVRVGESIVYVSPVFLALCQATPCQINLQKESDVGEIGDYSSFENIQYTLTLDKSTRTVTFEYATEDGSSVEINMNVTKWDSYYNQTICEESLTSSGGTLSCIVPQDYTNTTYIVEVYKTDSDEFITQGYFDLSVDAFDMFGYTGIILTALLFLTLALMGISSGIAVMFFGMLGLIFAGFLALFNTGNIIGVGSSFLWLIVAGIIIIYKIANRRNA